MNNRWILGPVVKVSAANILFTVNPNDIKTKIQNGIVQAVKGVNDYVYFRINARLIVIAKIYIVDDSSKPYIKDEPNSKFKDEYILSAYPIGEIKNGKYTAGVNNLPMVGQNTYYAGEEILKIIFNNETNDTAGLKIGCLTNNEFITPYLSGNKILSGYIAILGNTGSGKSTTAKVIFKQLSEDHKKLKDKTKFLIFDVHDDYKFLGDQSEGKYFNASEIGVGPKDFDIEDWESLLQPSEKTQKPILDLGLKLAIIRDDEKIIKLYFLIIRNLFTNGAMSAVLRYQITDEYLRSIYNLVPKAKACEKSNVQEAWSKFNPQYGNTPEKDGQKNFFDNLKDLCDYQDESLREVLDEIDDNQKQRDFSISDLAWAVDLAIRIEESEGNNSIRAHTEGILTRLRDLETKYSENFFSPNKSIVNDIENNESKFIILQVSSFDDDLLKLFSTYLTRKILTKKKEEKDRDKLAPCYLIFDEAHRYMLQNGNINNIFDRVSREGRKFGTYLIVISQRPSELSTVVLSQIKTYFIHRIQNNIDLRFILENVPTITQLDVKRLPLMPIGTVLVSSENDYSYELKVNDKGIPKTSKSILPF